MIATQFDLDESAHQPPVIEAASCTHVGMWRQANEDSLLAAHPVYIVADGMGGHDAGDRASAAAIAAFEPYVGRELTISDVEAAIDGARAAVAAVAQGRERGAGCTLTGAVLVDHEGEPRWYVLNIGDSRVYQHGGSGLTQITDDHSLHAELTAAGSADAAKTPRNVITRALGSEDTRHDGWLLALRTGARLLICSDGLTTEVTDEELRAVLSIGGSPQAVADELVRRACENGGRDNVSVIVVDTVAAGSAAAGAETGSFEAVTGDQDEEEDTQETIEVTRPVL